VTALASAGPPIISTRALRKTFRTRRGKRIVAVEGLDLDVYAGGVHGFLGPNGSGKTTTIRLLLGLMHADSGEMSLFGQPVPARLGDVIGLIGAIVEQPRLFPRLSGKQNLELLSGLGRHRQGPDRRRARTRRAEGARGRQLPQLLTGHAPAPRDRRRPAQEPRAVDPGRADERARPEPASARSAT